MGRAAQRADQARGAARPDRQGQEDRRRLRPGPRRDARLARQGQPQPAADPAGRVRPVLRGRCTAFLDTKRLRDIGVVTDNNDQGRVRRSSLGAAVRQERPQRPVQPPRAAPHRHRAAAPAVRRRPARPSRWVCSATSSPTPDLVNRVLGYCSYQPFLLQMFGHRLVEAHARQAARRPELATSRRT